MKRLARTGSCLLLAAGLLPGGVRGQTLAITNGVHTYFSLPGMAVTLSGSSELWLTAAADPLPGSVVDVLSEDAWVFLPNILPSTAAGYMSRFRVNGAAAVVDRNVRVVQYAMGAVVIPHPPSFKPLRLFSEPFFLGASFSPGQYTLYTGAALGGLNGTASSFTLKRGYMATVAANANGTGPSRCYIAQDADLEVAALPAEMDDAIRFVRVFPWRWVSKKGIAGNIESGLNVRWKYNWSIDQDSSRNLEYVAIRQTRWWPGLDQDWQARGVNHLLGYNEPDSAEQANISVGDALWSWPDLLGTGLRVGSPATTDGGRSGWLYPFIDGADAADLRVDFVAVHYYWCYNPADPDGATNQLYDFLKATYDRVKRPLWVTEWNNGANWTGCGDPTFAQQRAAVARMIEMLDRTPFVERYALYNWVEDVRRVKWDDGSLTSAGEAYRDQVSPLSYVQEVPEVGSPGIAQYLFEGDPRDTSGYANHAFAFGAPGYAAGRTGQAIDLDGTDDHLRLPANIAGESAAFTFAAWVRWDGGGNWQRIFDFGNGSSQYMFLTPSASDSELRFAITASGGGDERRLTGGAFPVGQWTHVAVALARDYGWLYVNGELVVRASLGLGPSDVRPTENFLGKSQYTADPLFNGRLDDVLIADYALSAGQIAALMNDRPPAFAAGVVAAAGAAAGQPYAASLAGAAADPDAGDTVGYAKLGGPAWLAVAADGGLSGIPPVSAGGVDAFVVRAADSAGLADFARLEIAVEPLLQVALDNPGFELPVTADYLLRPAEAGWTFRGDAGISANGSAYTSGNSPAPEGAQVACLSATGLISQRLADLIPGTNYTVRFLASQRQNTPGGQAGQTFDVRINNAVIGSFAPPQASAVFQEYTAAFLAPSDAPTLHFAGTNLNGGDNTALLDEVLVLGVPRSALPLSRDPVELGAAWDTSGLTLTWPPDHTGWRLEMQSDLTVTNWINVPGVDITNRFPIPADGFPHAFFRLVYP